MVTEDGTNPLAIVSLFPKMLSMLSDIIFELIDHYNAIIINVQHERNLTVDSVVLTSFFSETGFYLPYYFQCPMILISPIGPALHWSKFLGNPENPSYQPGMRMPFVEPMSFLERLFNFLHYELAELISPAVTGHMVASLLARNGLMEYHEFMNLYNNISLLLLGSHFVTHYSYPLAANTIEIGGIHCRNGKTLPTDLETFLNESPSGVVYVSFGSVIKSSSMAEDKKRVFIETFRQINHPIIWKWDEDDIPNLPSNVKLSKWLPQQDLLAHPNLKVFVTHGGLFSIQEALYHNTPIVGIPLGSDQKPNLLRAQRQGYAIMLDWQTLNITGLVKAINKVLHDVDVQQGMDQAHQLFIDQKETPLERAVWWVEYVMRHDGAEFLKPMSMSLSFCQYYLLDVIGFVQIIVLLQVLILYKCCAFCTRRCCKNHSHKSKTD